MYPTKNKTMLNRKIKQLLFLLLFFNIQLVLGQSGTTIPNQIPPTPETFKFARYGEIPVNESSGNATVNIPLHTFKVGSISVPMSISHSGGAVKVDEATTWTGINWQLNVGGVISRTVNDLPDENCNSTTRPLYTTGEFSLLTVGQKEALASNTIDTEVDIFNYSFDGYSGSFYLDKTFVPRLIKYDKELKIELSGNPTVGGILQTNMREITITTPDGTKYKFGGQFASESTRIGASGFKTVYAQTGFYLNSIENFLGDKVTFNYSNGGPSLETVGYYQILTKDVSVEPVGQCSPQKGTRVSSSLLSTLDHNGKLKLLSITSNRDSNSKVIFSSTNQNVAANKFTLNNITVNNDKGTIHRKIVFDYTPTSNDRFFLEYIKIYDGINTSTSNIHFFEYNSPQLLPARFSKSQDYLGYYNGINNSTLLPKVTDPFFVGMAGITLGDRSVVYAKAVYGSLKKVIYPTKGYTEFEYESGYRNPASSVVVTTSDKPGIRIMRIKNYDRINPLPLITRYYYNKKDNILSTTDSEIMVKQPHYTSESIVSSSCTVPSETNTCWPYTITSRNLHSDTQNSLYISDNNRSAYEYVTVSYGGDNFQNGGKQSKYFVQADLPLAALTFDNNYASTKKGTNTSLKNGTLINETFFSQNTQNVLKEITYTYSSNNGTHEKDKKIPSILVAKIHAIPQCTGITSPYSAHIFFGYYETFSWWYNLEKTETKEYLENGTVNSRTDYYYDSKLAGLPSRVVNTLNDITASTAETKFSYPPDLAGELFMSSLVTANRIDKPIKTEQYKDGIKLATEKTVYQLDDSFVPALILPSTVQTSQGLNNLEDKVVYHQYDNKGNPIEISQSGDIHTVFIWGYYQTQPIAKIENTTYAAVQSQVANLQTKSNTDTEPNLILALNALRVSLPNAQVTTYTYKPLVGISTITDPKGNKITYDYDENNRLKSIKDAQNNILSENQYNYRPN